MKKNKVKAFAPATVANVSCGFDVFGMAVHAPGDVVEMELTEEPGIFISSITGDGGLLPRSTEKNTAGVAVQSLVKAVNFQYGIIMNLHKHLPLGSGMGSSAASAVAALVAANELLGKPMTRKELLPFAVDAERMACGSGHADNVAPALLGGFVLIRNQQQLDVINIPVPKELVCVLVHPHIEIKTRDARLVLQQSLSLKDATTQWGNTAALVAGLMQNDYALIGRSLQDVVVEPVRSMLIPSFDKVKEQALANGALGCGISGSGPTIFALCRGMQVAQKVSESIQHVFHTASLKSEVYISEINSEGAKIID